MRSLTIRLFVLFTLWANALPAQITWRRTYGGFGSEDAYSVRQTADGGYMVAGSTGSLGLGGGDIYVIRIDEYGTPLWSRTYGGLGVQRGVSCRELVDGFIIAGTTNAGVHGGYDMLLIRTDVQGLPIWERNYGTADWDICNAMDVLADGFVLGGMSYGTGNPVGLAYVVRTDQNGDVAWTASTGGPYRTECSGISVTSDQGFILAGGTGTATGYDDGFLTKLDQSGQEVWTTYVGGDSLDHCSSVLETTNGDLVACGSTHSENPFLQIHLVSLDADGQFLWEQFIGNVADAGGAEIRSAPSGGFVFTGYNTLNLGSRDMILTVTDGGGWFQFGNNFGNGAPADGYSVDPTDDGGYVVAGWAENYGPGLRSVYVVKTDANGQTASLDVDTYLDPLPVPDLTSSSEQGQLWPSALSPGDPLHLRLNVPPGNAKAQVFDLRGTVVATFPVQQQETTTHLPDLAPGHYSLVVADGGGLTFRSRFIVVQ